MWPGMKPLPVALAVALLTANPSGVCSQSVETVRPLLTYRQGDLQSVLPKRTILLAAPTVIEKFLRELDSHPPDWKGIYGAGDDGHMDRLFELNRERDRMREGRPALQRQVAFVWEGIVSGYDPEARGFRLAIGPKVIPTKWGHVRFKPYGLPSGLIAVPKPELREELRARRSRGEDIEVDLVLTGRLIPEESLIYDFAHEEPGQGMIMPVVQVEQIDYFLLH